MLPSDLAQVTNIERGSYDFPWSHGVFRDCLFAGYTCVVLERDDEIVGNSFSVRVVLPASGCEMIAKVRRRFTCLVILDIVLVG